MTDAQTAVLPGVRGVGMRASGWGGWVCIGLIACGRGGVPAEPPAGAAVSVPAAGSLPPATPPPRPKGPLGEGAPQIADRALALLEPCASLARTLDGWTPAAGPPAVNPDALASACQGFDTLYASSADWMNRSRGSVRVLSGIARLYEDARILGVELRSGGGEPLASAVDHLRRSTKEEELAFRKILAEHDGLELSAQPRVLRDPGAVRSDIARRVENGLRDAEMLLTAFHNYGKVQGDNPVMYRRAMLAHFRTAIRTLWDFDRREIEVNLGPLDAGAREAWAAYAVAMERYVSTGERAIGTYLTGAVDRATADALDDELTAAQRAWKEAGAAALAAMRAAPPILAPTP